jgi:microsomal dipeptidase-like Zn-dependent dipeptidase
MAVCDVKRVSVDLLQTLLGRPVFIVAASHSATGAITALSRNLERQMYP